MARWQSVRSTGPWLLSILVMLSAVVVAAEGSSWLMAGQNLWNTRHQAAETRLSPHTRTRLGFWRYRSTRAKISGHHADE